MNSTLHRAFCGIKRTVFLFLVCCAAMASARAVGPVPLSEALFVDTEASTNVPLPACGGDPHIFGFSLEFAGSASNAVDVAFGVDADGDGALAPEETRLVMGWDCGEWFVRSESDGVELTESASTTVGPQTLRMSVRVGWSGRVPSVDVRTGDARRFVALSSEPLDWLHDCSWNLCRIASHGVDAHGASFSVSSSHDGMRVIVR